jgi:hypothetical protein
MVKSRAFVAGRGECYVNAHMFNRAVTAKGRGSHTYLWVLFEMVVCSSARAALFKKMMSS